MRKVGQVEQIIAGRLERLIEINEASPRKVALDLGRAQHDLYRRLRPEYAEARPLRWRDVDEVLDALGLPIWAVFEPALRPVDQVVLAFVESRGAASRAELAEHFGSEPIASLDVLLVEGMLDGGEAMTITWRGLGALKDVET